MSAYFEVTCGVMYKGFGSEVTDHILSLPSSDMCLEERCFRQTENIPLKYLVPVRQSPANRKRNRNPAVSGPAEKSRDRSVPKLDRLVSRELC